MVRNKKKSVLDNQKELKSINPEFKELEPKSLDSGNLENKNSELENSEDENSKPEELESEDLKIQEPEISKKIIRRPLVLILADGWGIASLSEANALYLADMAEAKKIISHYPSTILRSSDEPLSLRYATLGLGRELKELSEIQETDLSLGQILAQHEKKQLYLAESEKFSLLSSYFNYPAYYFDLPKFSEEIVVSSPTEDYQKNPAMSTTEIVKIALEKIKEGDYDFIAISLANIDEVAKSGDLSALREAIETVDGALQKISEAVLLKEGALLISAVAGWAEQFTDLRTNLISKEYSSNPVPFLLVAKEYGGQNIGWEDAPDGDLSLLQPLGSLSDVAPTILHLLGIKKPEAMSGKSLVE
ncbi:MAG: hypothetical protein MUF50_03975 [Planctomycetes bacterium]|jgi:bisphosphoglycerate-independent phosphoglycerate mutase (AlkP superfamily)|nr:hypothetical protein [Planctomycetota bacterium]